MIVGIGIDVVEVAKLGDGVLEDSFRQKVYTRAEIAECQRAKDSAYCFAEKFAAKEAFMKAIGAGLRQGVWFKDIEVLGGPRGQPRITATNEAERCLRRLNATDIRVSISRTSRVCVSVVTLER